MQVRKINFISLDSFHKNLGIKKGLLYTLSIKTNLGKDEEIAAEIVLKKNWLKLYFSWGNKNEIGDQSF